MGSLYYKSNNMRVRWNICISRTTNAIWSFTSFFIEKPAICKPKNVIFSAEEHNPMYSNEKKIILFHSPLVGNSWKVKQGETAQRWVTMMFLKYSLEFQPRLGNRSIPKLKLKKHIVHFSDDLLIPFDAMKDAVMILQWPNLTHLLVPVVPDEYNTEVNLR